MDPMDAGRPGETPKEKSLRPASLDDWPDGGFRGGGYFFLYCITMNLLAEVSA